MMDLPAPPEPPMPAPEGWDGILQPGEQILWQGRPVPGINWQTLDYGRILFGLVFGGFAAFWILAAALTGAGTLPGIIFPLFGLPFLAVGLKMVGEQLWLDQRRLRGTHYTLTTQAAFIATTIRGRRSLQRYPLKTGLPIALEDGDTGNLWFDERREDFTAGRTSNPNHRRLSRTYTSQQKIGFERIENPREVWHQLGRAIAALPASDTPA